MPRISLLKLLGISVAIILFLLTVAIVWAGSLRTPIGNIAFGGEDADHFWNVTTQFCTNGFTVEAQETDHYGDPTQTGDALPFSLQLGSSNSPVLARVPAPIAGGVGGPARVLASGTTTFLFGKPQAVGTPITITIERWDHGAYTYHETDVDSSDHSINFDDVWPFDYAPPPPNFVQNCTVSADTIPPTTTATVSPAPDANGLNTSSVTVQLHATDNVGGSGVKMIEYQATGAQPISRTLNFGNSVSIPISARGDTTISYFAWDNAGNAESNDMGVAKTLTVKIADAASSNTTCLPLDGTTWALAASLPVSVRGAGVVSDGRFVYSIGGYATGLVTQAARYDPTNNSWLTMSPLPDAGSEMAVAYTTGKLYAFGGYTGGPASNKTRIYDIATDTWSYGANMPAGRQGMGIGYFNGKIYLVGGFADATFGSAQNQTWAYDIQSNSWTTQANLPAAVGGPAFGLINGHLYIIGGVNSSGLPQTAVYDYNLASGSWTSRAPMPTSRYAPGSAVRNGQIWIFGGGTPFLSRTHSTMDAPDTLLSVTEIYNPSSNSWTTGPSQNVARNMEGAATVGNQIIAVGGYSGGASSPLTEAIGVVPGLRILLVYADVAAPATLQSALQGLPGLARLDLFNAQNSMPTPGQLKNYDVIVTWSNYQYADSTALGNELADFENAGGVVVALNFDWYAGYTLNGWWQTVGYSPFNASSAANFQTASLGAIDVPNSPLMVKVNDITAYYRVTTTLTAGATQIAEWSDGTPLLAVKGRAVGTTGYFGDAPSPQPWSGDVAQLIWNAAFSLRQTRNTCLPLVYLPALLK